MKLLFLGGTQFVGRHMVAAALAKGWEVTLFNRGQTNADLFPEAEKLRGDRDGGMQALEGRRWDAVIDVNGYVPRLVRASAELLKDAVDHYVFVSTGSVYDMQKLPPNADESGPLATLEDETTEEWNGPAYGGLKVLCEKVVEEVMPGRALSLRLGVVAGSYDPTDRVTYWTARVARGGEVFIPGEPQRPLQFIYARDLADFTMLALEKRLTGIYNTAGQSMTWQRWLEACETVSGSHPTYVWCDDDDFLQAYLQANFDPQKTPFGLIPMRLPAHLAHLRTISNAKAEQAGLTYSAPEEMAQEILDWEQARPADEPRVAGLTPAQERDLLAQWRAKQ